MFIDILTKRRSIRKYQQKPVEKEKIDLLVEAALRAPSSRGVAPWAFVVVTDPGIIGQLARAKPHGAAFLKNAPLAIVVCADTEKSDVWVEDASIATICLHLAATDLGLGSCWIQMRLRNYNNQQTASDYIAEVLGLGKGLAVEAILAIGYPDEEKKPHDKGSLPYEKVNFR
jgi:nitroreductase